MPILSSYEMLTARNMHYISPEVQEKIKNTKLLIAGCGMWSSFACLAARMGFTQFIVADGDTVSPTNLNRQFYTHDDIGLPKTTALAKHIHEINPSAIVEELPVYLTLENIWGIVSRADFVFDTVDFLDLVAIVELHDQCELQKKPRITALNVGFDGGILFFPSDTDVSFREVFWLPKIGPVEHLNYLEAYKKVIQKLSVYLNPEVIYAISMAMTTMKDGTPCPASQIAPGSFGVASLAGTMIYRIFAWLPVSVAPEFIVSHNHQILNSPGINLLKDTECIDSDKRV